MPIQKSESIPKKRIIERKGSKNELMAAIPF